LITIILLLFISSVLTGVLGTPNLGLAWGMVS